MAEHTPSQLESDLAELYAASAPEDFAKRLGAQLQARAGELRAARQGAIPWWRRIAWSRRTALAFTLVILLILASIVAAVGPQRALAAVQKLLGYIPGIGFVDLDQARQLASPVTVIRDGVTFQLERVVAQSDKTWMTFSIQGLSGAGPEGAVMAFEPKLRLPNQRLSRLSALEYSSGRGSSRGKIEFPAIPAEFDRAWLEFDYLPEATPGAAPEDWQVPFELLPAAETPASGDFVQSYFLSDASASASGVTIQVLQVARTESEMAVQLRATWDDPNWQYEPSWPPVMRDDLGHIYRERTEGPEGSIPAAEEPGEGLGGSIQGFGMLPPPSAITTPGPAPHLDQTYIYPGASAMARRWTLSLPEMEFYGPAQASFQVDLGENPVPGQTLPVDQWVQVAGMDVHILAMRLAEEAFSDDPGAETEYILTFIMEAVPQDHRRMYMLGIVSSTEEITGGGAEGGSHMEQLEASLNFSRIPKGKIDVRINEATVTIEGPWEVSWELPAAGNAPLEARFAHPEVVDTHHGVTLGVKEAVLTDRMTRLELASPGLPRGAELVSTFPSSAEDTVYLEDESGRRLDEVQEIGTAEIYFNPAELRFASLPVQPETLLLYVPEVEIFYPGEAALAVEVPQGLQFHEETEIIEEGYTRQRWVSDPWPVDLPLEIGGYRLYFDQARLERRKGKMEGMYDYRLELAGQAPTGAEDEVRFSRLRVARIARPDGSTQTFDRDSYRRISRRLPHSGLRPAAPGSTEMGLILSIDVSSPDGIGLAAGWHTVELDGLALRVRGPWRLRWTLER